MRKMILVFLVSILCTQNIIVSFSQPMSNVGKRNEKSEKLEVTYIHNKSIMSKGIVLLENDSLTWQENIELWQQVFSNVMCMGEDMQSHAYLELESLNTDEVNISEIGKYTVKAKLKLKDEYIDEFYISDEMRTLEIPIYICDVDKLYLGHVSTTSDFIEFHWIHDKEDEAPVIYYAEKMNKKNEDTDVPKEDEFKLIESESLVSGSGRFLVYRTFLDQEKIHYFRLKIGNNMSNIIRVYGDTATVVDDGTGGDRDPSEPGGVKPPDIVQPPPKPDIEDPPSVEEDEDDKKDNDVDIGVSLEEDTEVVQNNNKEEKILESFGKVTDIISGTRLKKMIDGNETVSFSKEGITIYIPSKVLEDLNIKEDDTFKVTIKKISNSNFIIGIDLNGESISQISDTKVMLEYQISKDDSDVILLNENSETISNGKYDETIGVVTFNISETGEYEILEETTKNTMHDDINQEKEIVDKQQKSYIVASIIVIIFIAVIILKKGNYTKDENR